MDLHVDFAGPGLRSHLLMEHAENPGKRLQLSFRRLGLGGQSEMKTCAARGVIGSPQAPPCDSTMQRLMRSPVRLGSKEGIEDLFCLLLGQSYAAWAMM